MSKPRWWSRSHIVVRDHRGRIVQRAWDVSELQYNLSHARQELGLRNVIVTLEDPQERRARIAAILGPQETDE